jgi:tetratricopeptide (TPR) repeat protein
MDKNTLYKILDEGIRYKEASAAVAEIIEAYPYFTAARVIHLLLIADNLALQSEHLAAVTSLVSDKRNLFRLLHTNEKKYSITKEQEKALTTKDQEVVQPSDLAFIGTDEAGAEAQNSTITIDAAPDGASAGNTELLEIGEGSNGEHEDQPSESYTKGDKVHTFIDAQLYTLEIPGDFLHDGNYSSLMPNLVTATPPVNNEKATNVEEDSSPTTSQQSLIDAFIDANPRISPPKPIDAKAEIEDISLASLKEPEDAVSEQLALIYISQGLSERAILIYEKLSLIYPEKSIYFAGQIQKIRKQLED